MVPQHASIELTTTLQKVKIPSFVADRNGTITWLNDAAKEAFGDLAGRRYTTFVAREDVPLAQRQLER